jgi:hypothetical protein
MPVPLVEARSMIQNPPSSIPYSAWVFEIDEVVSGTARSAVPDSPGAALGLRPIRPVPDS